eukprot:PLAT4415.4.p1 GENE.PLAT4415.4~~PLAT4415.4.p1  ORF type:complete len:1154 (-),score=330.53 PLAT4415.4:758-3889(-)
MFAMRLARRPTAAVRVTLRTAPQLVRAVPSALHFPVDRWDVPQAVRLCVSASTRSREGSVTVSFRCYSEDLAYDGELPVHPGPLRVRLLAAETFFLWSMGDNSHGQLGLPPMVRSAFVPQLISLRSERETAAGAGGGVVGVEAYGRDEDDTIMHGDDLALGSVDDGDIDDWDGRSDYDDEMEESAEAALASGRLPMDAVVAIACGTAHSAVVTERGMLFAAGDDSCGQLGVTVSDAASSRAPSAVSSPTARARTTGSAITTTMRPVAGFLTIVSVQCGPDYTAAINDVGQLLMWGSNAHGQLGLGDCLPRSSPVVVDGLRMCKTRQVACGKAHVLALTDGDDVFSWGFAKTGALGHGDDMLSGDQLLPLRVSSLSSRSVFRVAAGALHSAVLCGFGVILVAGWGEDGRLGWRADETCVSRFQEVAGVLSDKVITDVACGGRHTLVLTDEGLVFAWGGNEHGQLGVGDEGIRTQPTLLPLLADRGVNAIVAGDAHSAALTESGMLYTWGCGYTGELGLGGDVSQSNVPQLNEALLGLGVLTVAAGGAHTLALTAESPRSLMAAQAHKPMAAARLREKCRAWLSYEKEQRRHFLAHTVRLARERRERGQKKRRVPTTGAAPSSFRHAKREAYAKSMRQKKRRQRRRRGRQTATAAAAAFDTVVEDEQLRDEAGDVLAPLPTELTDGAAALVEQGRRPLSVTAVASFKAAPRAAAAERARRRTMRSRRVEGKTTPDGYVMPHASNMTSSFMRAKAAVDRFHLPQPSSAPAAHSYAKSIAMLRRSRRHRKAVAVPLSSRIVAHTAASAAIVGSSSRGSRRKQPRHSGGSRPRTAAHVRGSAAASSHRRPASATPTFRSIAPAPPPLPPSSTSAHDVATLVDEALVEGIAAAAAVMRKQQQLLREEAAAAAAAAERWQTSEAEEEQRERKRPATAHGGVRRLRSGLHAFEVTARVRAGSPVSFEDVEAAYARRRQPARPASARLRGGRPPSAHRRPARPMSAAADAKAEDGNPYTAADELAAMAEGRPPSATPGRARRIVLVPSQWKS